jgi:hypothetical protein
MDWSSCICMVSTQDKRNYASVFRSVPDYSPKYVSEFKGPILQPYLPAFTVSVTYDAFWNSRLDCCV